MSLRQHNEQPDRSETLDYCSCGALCLGDGEMYGRDDYERWRERPRRYNATAGEFVPILPPEGYTFRMLIDDCIGKLAACRGAENVTEELIGLVQDIEERTEHLIDGVFPA